MGISIRLRLAVPSLIAIAFSVIVLFRYFSCPPWVIPSLIIFPSKWLFFPMDFFRGWSLTSLAVLPFWYCRITFLQHVSLFPSREFLFFCRFVQFFSRFLSSICLRCSSLCVSCLFVGISDSYSPSSPLGLCARIWL